MPKPTPGRRAGVMTVTLLLSVGGCGLPGGGASPSASTRAASPRATGSASPAPSAGRSASTAAGSAATGQVSGTVVWVSDGDTIDIRTGSGRRQRVRLLGVDAPEVAHSGAVAACGGDSARTAMRTMALGGTVVVTKDAHTAFHDRYGRLLGYVTLGRTDLSMWLLRQGLAEAWRPKSARDPERWQAYVAASALAKAHRTGSWRSCTHLGR